MKKLGLLLAVFALAACSSGGKETKGTGEVTNTKGEVTTAEVTLKDGKITAVKLDSKQKDAEKTKKEIGAAYGMKDASTIKKEWNEQIEALEKSIVSKGVDGVKVDAEGKPTDADVLSGCTMDITDFVDAVKDAESKAK